MNAAGRAERVIEPMGLYVVAGLTVFLAMVKLTGLREWSWWRIALPLIIILGFNAVYIITGFLYFSLVAVKERPPEEETSRLRTHDRIPYYWTSLLGFGCFTVNAVRRLEPPTELTGLWLLSGKVEVLVLFGSLALASLWLYWSRIGQWLNNPENGTP